MKTSKIIISSYFSLMGLVLLGILVSGAIFNNEKPSHLKNIAEETIDLSVFKHIVVKKDCKLSITSSNEWKMTYDNRTDSSKIEPIYELKNDTLFVISTKTNHWNNVTISCSNIETINSKNSRIYLNKLDLDTLVINASKSKIQFEKSVKLRKCYLNLSNNSNSYNWGTLNCDELNLDVDHSKVNLRNKGKVPLIKGMALNNSDIRLPQSSKFLFEIDESSKLSVD